MSFWEMGYKNGWFGIELLQQAIITDENPYGEITQEEYEQIIGE